MLCCFGFRGLATWGHSHEWSLRQDPGCTGAHNHLNAYIWKTLLNPCPSSCVHCETFAKCKAPLHTVWSPCSAETRRCCRAEEITPAWVC